MNALFVITGLGIFSLLAEFGNLKKWLTGFVVAGLAAAVVLAALDWNTAVPYFSHMLVFDNLALAFTALISILTIIWFWLSADYFTTGTHRTDRTSLIVFAVVGAVIMASFNNMAMLLRSIRSTGQDSNRGSKRCCRWTTTIRNIVRCWIWKV